MNNGQIGIFTVDFITPIVDSPKRFGRIAAANALSDVFAMGGTPLLALNVVGFPLQCEPLETLGEILKGGAEKVIEAGAVLAGGHSVQDEEPKYGLVVYGEVDESSLWKVTGAKPGDYLILTKGLGTGVVAAAIKAGLLAEEKAEIELASMERLNALPVAKGSSLRSHIHACTDVTGFGLVGHLLDMLSEGELDIDLAVETVPLLPSALDLARMGLVPAGTYLNRDYVGERFALEDKMPSEWIDLLFDPQTSGGLLLAVSHESAEELREKIQNSGFHQASIIGSFKEGSGLIHARRGSL